MSTDLCLERFGLELFNLLFQRCEGLPLPISGEYRNVRSTMNTSIYEVVILYLEFFHKLHSDTFSAACVRPVTNAMDLFQTASKHFPHRHLQNDEVMAKFLLSCAYFFNVIVANDQPPSKTNRPRTTKQRGSSARRVNLFQKAHLMWAMFADMELKDIFYAAGGWGELNRFVWCMRPALNMGKMFMYQDSYWPPLLEAITRTLTFLVKAAFDAETPLSLQWVDFVVRTPRGPPVSMDGYTIRQTETLISSMRWLEDPTDVQDALFSWIVDLAKEEGADLETASEELLNFRRDRVPEIKRAWERHLENKEAKKKIETKITKMKLEELALVVET